MSKYWRSVVIVINHAPLSYKYRVLAFSLQCNHISKKLVQIKHMWLCTTFKRRHMWYDSQALDTHSEGVSSPATLVSWHLKYFTLLVSVHFIDRAANVNSCIFRQVILKVQCISMHCLPQEGVPRLTPAQVPEFVLSLHFTFHVIPFRFFHSEPTFLNISTAWH